MDLGHRIVAMVASTPKRVVCMTCGSEHNYRPPKSALLIKEGSKRRAAASPSAATSTSSARTRSAAKTLARDEWERRVRSGAPFRRYNIHESFSENDLISHKKFGDGYVTAANGGKITVAFADGERTLVHDTPE